jgi:chaperonin GroEL
VQETKEGYDFKNHTYGDLLKTGVIDPVKVTRLALEHAVSIAGILVTSQVLIVEKKEDKKDEK